MGRAVLTEVAVKRLRPPPVGRLEVWDAALPSFGVRITENGRRSWILVTRLRGRPVRLTIGKYPATGLADARELAREAIQEIARGIDPRLRKRAAADPTVDTFEVVAADFIERWEKPRNRTWDETERIFDRYVTPHWQGRRLREIGRRDVSGLVGELAKTTPIQANRVLAKIKKLMAWALNEGIIDAHPAVGITPPAEERERERVLSDAELRRLWAAWTEMGYPWGAALGLLLLTAARRGEVEEMTWPEIDVGAGLWEIPGARYKNGKPHVVPLAPASVAVLAGIPRLDGCAYVFTTRENKAIRDWSGAVGRATVLSGVSDWTAHDLRRTVRTNLPRLGIQADTAERVLGHAIMGVRRAYDRYGYLDEKRAALETWAERLAQVVRADG